MCTNLKFCAGRIVPCGKCDECLRKKRIVEYNRVKYEFEDSYVAYHVTLTYADLRNFDGFADIRDFFKGLRKEVGECSYYSVYEEGELHGRPHFHVLLFFKKGVCLNQRLIVKHWKNGFVKCRIINKVCEVRYLTNYLFKQYGKKDIRNFSCSNHFGYKSFVKKYFPNDYYDYIVNSSVSSDFLANFFDVENQERLVKKLYYDSWFYLPRVWRDKYYSLVNTFLNLLDNKAVSLFFKLSSYGMLKKRTIDIKYFDYFVDYTVSNGYYQDCGRKLEFDKKMKCVGLFYGSFVSHFGLQNMTGCLLDFYKWFCDNYLDCFDITYSVVPDSWKNESLRLKYISGNRNDYICEGSYPTMKYLRFGVSGYFELSKNELNNLVVL